MTASVLTFTDWMIGCVTFCLAGCAWHLLWAVFIRPWLEGHGHLTPLSVNDTIPLTVWPGIFLEISAIGFIFFIGDAAGY